MSDGVDCPRCLLPRRLFACDAPDTDLLPCPSKDQCAPGASRVVRPFSAFPPCGTLARVARYVQQAAAVSSSINIDLSTILASLQVLVDALHHPPRQYPPDVSALYQMHSSARLLVTSLSLAQHRLHCPVKLTMFIAGVNLKFFVCVRQSRKQTLRAQV